MPNNRHPEDQDSERDPFAGGSRGPQVTQQLWAVLDAFRLSQQADVDRDELLRREHELEASGVVASGALIAILDKQGRILWISRSSSTFTGCRSTDLVGTRLCDTSLASQTSDQFQESLRQVCAFRRFGSCESRGITRQGDPLRVVWSLRPSLNELGAVVHVIGVGMDISDQPVSEHAHQLEESRLNSLLELSQKAAELSEREIIQHTLEEVARLTQSQIGYLHFVNKDQESIELFAWTEQSLKECTAAYDSHYPLSRAGVWADCARLKQPVVHNDYQRLTDKQGYPEGHSHLIRHASVPLLDGEDVVMILGVGNKPEDYDNADVRQMLLAADSLWKILLRRRAEEELRRHVEALEKADRQKDEFLAMLAHELRNPLAPVSTALQILGNPSANSDLSQQAIDVITRQVKHMTRLVDDLLDVSRITRGKIKLHPEALDLREIVQGAIEVNRSFLDGRQHRLDVTVPDHPLVVEGDRVRLTQVVSNLLHNAAKYTPDGGQVALSVEPGDGVVQIRIQDSGVGIAPEVLPHVFDVFVQADDSLDRSRGGLGLGLTLVQRLVALHGGEVEARSQGLESGSEFVVSLPWLEQPISHLTESPSDTELRRSGSPLRVLVVDDNDDAANMLQALLTTIGYDVEMAENGQVALEKLNSFRPRVVLLDIGLPKMDGFQVARQIRSQLSRDQVALVALTGYGHERSIERAQEAGFDHYLIKPFDPEHLIELLEACCEPSEM